MEHQAAVGNQWTQQEFALLFERYRAELRVHCYRMLGSFFDAEDAVQDVYVRAWERRSTYMTDSALRAWLYRIATNLCLDRLKYERRRAVPMSRDAASHPDAPIPADVNEPIWLDPYPDHLLQIPSAHPEEKITARENIRIAFIALLHLLPPRQRTVLLLTDVLEYSVGEIAVMLETSVSAVKSTLHRARKSIASYQDSPLGLANSLPPAALSAAQLEAYVSAWETADIDALMRLLHEDASFSMPPIPSWYMGRANVRALLAKTVFGGAAVGRWRLLPTQANRQVAFGLYRLAAAGDAYHVYGIQVLTPHDSAIHDIITFRRPTLCEWFQLPPVLPV